MKTLPLIVTTGIAGVICAFAAASYANSVSAEDFVHKASIANQFEIESSKLALDKSENGDIKKFARRMIDDHTKTGDKLEEALQSSKSGAEASDDLDDKHEKMIDELDNASGADFDSKYIAMQTKAHQKAVTLFSEYSRHGKDNALRHFATQTLPSLKAHLQHVERLKARM